MERGLVSNYAEQIRGVSYKPNDIHDGLDKDSVILLRANNIDDGRINFDDVVYVDRKKVSKSQYLRKGDVLICASSGSRNLVGKAAFVDFEEECTFGAFCKVVRPKKVTPEFLGLFFQSPSYRKKISALAQGANINNIKNEHIDNLQLAIYSEKEQRQIIERITRVITIIHARKQELSKLDELIKARFVEMFGDYHTNSKGFESHKGSELFKFASGKFLPEEKREREGVPVYGGNGITWYTDESLIDYPTIIIGRVGALCGNIHSVREPVWITDNAIYIKEHKTEKFTLEFLTEMMTIMDFYQYADFSGQPKITQKPLESLHYLTPPIEMQNEFTEFCRQVDRSKVAIQKSLEETQVLFDSLMQQYFG